MQVAAFTIGCVAFLLSIGSLTWQIYSWRQDRRFDVRLEIGFPIVPLGERRYDMTVVVSNRGRTDEALQELRLVAMYDREFNRKLTFYSPELIADPATDRQLPPNRSFSSTFNLMSKLIGGRGNPEDFPTEVIGVAELQSGRQVFSEPYQPPTDLRDHALEDPPAHLSIPSRHLDDYFPQGPRRPCPDCRTAIPSDARVCRYCGHEIYASEDG
jgi:hypothetical protein